MKEGKKNIVNILLIIVSVILGIALAGIVTWRVIDGRNAYHAVFLRTGDLYFGKLVRFPTFGMKNVYFVQATGDQENPLSIQKFSNVFWGPEDAIQINKKEVVWTAQVRKDSNLARLLKENPNLENRETQKESPAGTSAAPQE